MKNIQFVFNAIWAEWQKSRRSRFFWVLLLPPLLITLIVFFFFLDSGRVFPEPWSLLETSGLQLYAYIMYPLAVIMLTSNSMQLEHRNNTWKHLHAMPVPLWTILLGKFLFVLFFIVVSLALLLLLMEPSGFLLGILKPSTGFQEGALHWASALKSSFWLWVCVLPIFAIQFYASWRISSFHIPVYGALVALVISLSLSSMWDKSVYIPYAFVSLHPMYVKGSLNVQKFLEQPLFYWYALLYFAAFTVLTFWQSRKNLA